MFEGPFMWLRSVAEVGLSARTHDREGSARTLAGSVPYDDTDYTAIPRSRRSGHDRTNTTVPCASSNVPVRRFASVSAPVNVRTIP